MASTIVVMWVLIGITTVSFYVINCLNIDQCCFSLTFQVAKNFKFNTKPLTFFWAIKTKKYDTSCVIEIKNFSFFSAILNNKNKKPIYALTKYSYSLWNLHSTHAFLSFFITNCRCSSWGQLHHDTPTFPLERQRGYLAPKICREPV